MKVYGFVRDSAQERDGVPVPCRADPDRRNAILYPKVSEASWICDDAKPYVVTLWKTPALERVCGSEKIVGSGQKIRG